MRFHEVHILTERRKFVSSAALAFGAGACLVHALATGAFAQTGTTTPTAEKATATATATVTTTGASSTATSATPGTGTTTATTATKDKVVLRAQLGIIYAQNGQTNEARTEFVKLLEEPTGRAAALTNLGNLAVLDSDLNTGIENYVQAAALDTADPGILLDLGLAYKQAGRDADSERVFAEALEKAGGVDRASYLLGIRADGDTSKGKVSKLSNEEIKAMLAKARTRVPDATTKGTGKEPERTQVVSRPGGARASDVAVGPTSFYWKEK